MHTFLIWLSFSPFLSFSFISSSLSMLCQTNWDVIFCFTRIDCQNIIRICIFYNIQNIQIRITILQSIGVLQNVLEFAVFQKDIKFIYICKHTFLIWHSFSLFLSFFFYSSILFLTLSLSVIFFFIFFFSFYVLSNKLRCYILLHSYWLSNYYTNLDIL